MDLETLLKVLRVEGIRDQRILDAIERIPRERFVPDALQHAAYENRPLPIGHGQTISQPYVVARMTELLGVHEDSRILKVGTGSGYQTAVLAELGAEVFTIELIEELAERAKEVLTSIGYERIHYRVGDGNLGWVEEAPFDGILVTAAPRSIPEAIVSQLEHGAPLVIPVGDMTSQQLVVLRRTMNGVATVEAMFPVRFVPLLNAGGE